MTITGALFTFIAAAVFANLMEWVAHKYILHGLGKKKDSWFHHHWVHHNIARKNDFLDVEYDKKLKSEHVRKEIYGLLGMLFLNSWLLLVWPLFFVFCVGFAALYYYCHSYSHKNVAWAKRWLPWHYDHHMGKNQDANWGVTLPLWDWILKTRIPGPAKEKS